MALTVEDGTVVSLAESYLSADDGDTYFSKHGSPSEWTSATLAQKESALRYATTYLDSQFDWRGEIYSTLQVLDWPRTVFYDDDGRSLGGSGNMPQALLDATAEMALEYLKDNFVEGTTNIKRERIGSAEVEYTGAGSSSKNFLFVAKILRRIGKPRANQVRVRRG